MLTSALLPSSSLTTVTRTRVIERVSVQDFDLGSGTAESHGRAMKIVAEYEIRESEVEVVEEEKQPWH